MNIDEEDYRMAQFCDALSNAVRLKIVLILNKDSKNVSSLASELDRDRTTISRHLGILDNNDLVESTTEGRKNIYSLKRPDLIDKFLELRPLLRR